MCQLLIFAYVVALIMYISNESISSCWVNGLIYRIAIRTTTIATSAISSSNDVVIRLNAVANVATRITGPITDINDLGLVNVTHAVTYDASATRTDAIVDAIAYDAIAYDAIAYDASTTRTDANETSDAYDEAVSRW